MFQPIDGNIAPQFFLCLHILSSILICGKNSKIWGYGDSKNYEMLAVKYAIAVKPPIVLIRKLLQNKRL